MRLTTRPNWIHYSSLLFFLILLSHCLSPPATSQEIKVMTWNILHGGQNETLPEDGRPIIIDIIKESRADIILMIENLRIGSYDCRSVGI